MQQDLSKISTRAPKDMEKTETKEKLVSILEELDELQNLLFAEGKHSLLVVIQGMDASGKDGAIKNVFGTLNPQGVSVTSFKTPTPEEIGHDFLWRIHKHAPLKGTIQVFNRSHYEDVLITRVHKWIDDETAFKRMKAINNFEKLLLQHNQTHVLKFYLHVSKEEQEERLNERISDVTKQWKYNENDFKEAKLWDDYMKAYEDCFEQCNEVPWTIVPADQNWFKEYTIASAVRDTLKDLNMKYPGMKKE
ncbi:PPK2 family polyphosphate kinase [Segetibacter aerophilus]|uniref:Polyphosphate kinase n=1 Tax=Segetibacter aerophilus TaxID=670293 RepID=A0A512BH24_9BACT|nr:PPK2 family polyphosphate kinase [Segetibacter aerophilus]GEO11274.1 polyphosphate kinase [Segetibacter aerophilus]